MNEEKREALRKEFSAMLDNELDPETRAALEAELAEDAELLRELEGLKRVDSLYRELPPHAAPEDFEARVYAALEGEKVVDFPPTRRIGRIAAPLLAAAAAFLIIGGGIFLSTSPPLEQGFQMTQAPAERERSQETPAADSAPLQEDAAFDADDALPPPATAMPEPAASKPAEQPMPKPAKQPAPMPEASVGTTSGGAGIGSRLEKIGTDEPKRDTFREGLGATAPGAPRPSAAAPIGKSESGRTDTAPPMPNAMMDNAFSRSAAPQEMAEAVELDAAASGPHADTALSPEEHFQKLREHHNRTRDIRPLIEMEDARMAGGRDFVMEQGVWIEGKYLPDLPDIVPEFIEIGSEAYTELLDSHPGLAEIAGLEPFALAEFGGKWYFLYGESAAGE